MKGATSTRARILVAIAATLVVAILVGGAIWATTCPCGPVPGFMLRGDLRSEPVLDWRFANDVPLCQVQITVGWRPHSVNVNCMATPGGQLFVSCSFGERKYWCPQVGKDQPARLRLDGVVYPVLLNRVTDRVELDGAWAARLQKLQNPEVQRMQPGGMTPPPQDAARPEHWWTFEARSAAVDRVSRH